MKKKILLISQYFPPDISGGGTRAFNYAKCLADKYDVTVITAFPHLHFAVPKKYRKKVLVKERDQGFDIIRVFVPSLLHSSIKNRIFLHVSFIFSSFFGLFSTKPDVIIASEPNLFCIIPAYIFSKIRGGKIIRVVDDLWPEVIYERFQVKSSIIKGFLNRLAKFSYTEPEIILPLTDEAKKHIEENYNIDESKIEVIEHGVDEKIFDFKEKDREEFFTLMYSGAIVDSYDFDLILNAAKNLKEKKIRFIIRGKGELKEGILDKIRKEKLTNVSIDDTIVPYEEISTVLSKADVFLIPMKDESTLNMSLPTKILEYKAIGRPIICCSSGAPGNFVEKTKSGVKLEYGDLNEFIKCIIKLKENPELCKEMGRNGRIFVEENLTFEKIGNRLSETIETLE